MPSPKKNKPTKKKDIEFTTLTDEKTNELNGLLDTIVDTLNGMGKEINKNRD